MHSIRFHPRQASPLPPTCTLAPTLVTTAPRTRPHAAAQQVHLLLWLLTAPKFSTQDLHTCRNAVGGERGSTSRRVGCARGGRCCAPRAHGGEGGGQCRKGVEGAQQAADSPKIQQGAAPHMQECSGGVGANYVSPGRLCARGALLCAPHTGQPRGQLGWEAC
jgi:hypothetical protein